MTTSTSWLLRTNIFLLIGLSISIPASKAGMNAFLYLYVISSFSLLAFSDIKLSKPLSMLMKSSVAVFGIGAVLAIVSKGSFYDVAVYIQKYSYLLLPTALVVSVVSFPKSLKWSIVAFLSSIVTCIFIDLYLFAFVYDFFDEGIIRLWGRIGYSRWPAVLITGITITLLFLFNQKKRLTWAYGLCFILISIFALILAGSKGGIVALAFVISGFLLVVLSKSKKVAVALVFLLVFTLTTDFFQDNIANRGLTSSSLQSESIVARTTMIETAIELTKINLTHNMSYFLFGSGLDKPEVSFQQTLDELPQAVSENLIYQGRHWGYTDLHNSYLDQLFKNGLIFSLLFYWLLYLMVRTGFSATQKVTQYQSLGIMYTSTIISFIIFNAFYSNFSDYAVYSQIYFIALALALPLVTEVSGKPGDE
ncbi:O-antigen ligase family protein [Vibrio sp. 10N.261.51.F12]|uniref:O-antigen ligase family protein n=1 Tax=Vibrio sp. 10N.261.51.F12 TaxID=3229679 RepID=UPI00354ED878